MGEFLESNAGFCYYKIMQHTDQAHQQAQKNPETLAEANACSVQRPCSPVGCMGDVEGEGLGKHLIPIAVELDEKITSAISKLDAGPELFFEGFFDILISLLEVKSVNSAASGTGVVCVLTISEDNIERLFALVASGLDGVREFPLDHNGEDEIKDLLCLVDTLKDSTLKCQDHLRRIPTV